MDATQKQLASHMLEGGKFRIQMSHQSDMKTLGKRRLCLPRGPSLRAHANELADLKITASVLLPIKALYNYHFVYSE